VYTGFTSTPASQSVIPAIQAGNFYQNTISYTSSAQASASLTFTGMSPNKEEPYSSADLIGSAIYVFGPTGPSFGVFQVSIDTKPIGTYNASTTVATYDTLLFFTTQLDPSAKHQIIVTNQVEGSTLALDYFVIVSDSSGGQGQPNGVWPGEQAVQGSDSSSVLVGGLLGGLAAFVSRFLCLLLLQYDD
jgi:hypothetical protein